MLYTAPFLTVNGVPLTLQRFEEETVDVDDFQRGGGADVGLDGLTYAPKRRWMFETVPVVPAEAEALTGWIEGRGIQWRFDLTDTATTRFTYAAHDGSLPLVFPTASSTGTTRAAGWRSANPKHGVWALQLSGTSTAYDGTTTTYPFSHTVYTAPFGLVEDHGITLSYWARNYASADAAVASYTLLSQIWDQTESTSTAVYYVGSTATLPNSTGLPFRRTSTFAATVGWCSFTFLSGASINTTSTTLFDSVLLLPYRLTGDMLVARTARTEAEGALPYVLLGGHALQDPDEVEVKGFVEERRPTQCTIAGVWYDNAEVLSGVFVEK